MNRMPALMRSDPPTDREAYDSIMRNLAAWYKDIRLAWENKAALPEWF